MTLGSLGTLSSVALLALLAFVVLVWSWRFPISRYIFLRHLIPIVFSILFNTLSLLYYALSGSRSVYFPCLLRRTNAPHPHPRSPASCSISCFQPFALLLVPTSALLLFRLSLQLQLPYQYFLVDLGAWLNIFFLRRLSHSHLCLLEFTVPYDILVLRI